MAIDNGTYVIVSALSAAKALDVRGASDRSVANIQLYSRNGGDSQWWHLWHTSDNSSGEDTVQMYSPLCGNVADVAGALANGVNVQKYNDANTIGQRWDVVADGETMTVDGVEYPTYVIKCHADNAFCMDVTGGATANSTNVQVYECNGTDAQRWAFVPIAGIPNGVYTIQSAMASDLCLDVAGGSNANGANVQVYGNNGTNAQAWLASTDAQTGVTTFVNVGSGKAMRFDATSETEAPADGTNVSQWTTDGSRTKNFFLQPYGTMKRNGVTVPAFLIRAQSGNGKCIDVAGGSTKIKTNVQLYSANGTDAQRFGFYPTEAEASNLPVPSWFRLEVNGTDSGTHDGNVVGTEQEDGSYVFPAYVTVDNTCYDMQVRYRFICHRAEDFDSTVTGEWRSVENGSTGNGGWGELMSANVHAERMNNGRLKCPVPIAVSNFGVEAGQYSFIEVEIQARSFRKSWTNGAGNVTTVAHSATGTDCQNCYVKWRPSVTFDQAALCFDGLWFPYVSDYPRANGSCVLTVSDSQGRKVLDGYRATSLPDNGTIKVPYSKCLRVPEDNETLSVEWTWTTPEAAIASGVQKVVVSYDTNHGVTVSPTLEYDKLTATYVARFAEAASTRCIIQFDGIRGTIMQEGDFLGVENGLVAYRVVPPMGIDWRVICFAYNSDSSWGTHDDVLHSLPAHEAHMWNWGDGEFAQLPYKEGEPRKLSATYSADVEEHVTTGRERVVDTFGSTVAVEFVAEGTIVAAIEEPGQTFEAFVRLAHSGPDGKKVTYRTPWGGWHRVGVKSVQLPQQWRGKTAVTVTMNEVSD